MNLGNEPRGVDGSFREVLPCHLTSEERQARGLQLAGLLEEIDEIEAELSMEKKRVGEMLKARFAQVSHLARQVRTGCEDREVSCIDRVNEYDQRIETLRIDTGELVRSRPMGFSERQARLFPAQAERVQERIDGEAIDGNPDLHAAAEAATDCALGR